MSDITWSFAGKVALVSGGASGIGRAAAAAWVAAGARVAVFDQSPERLEETAAALGREALATVAGDVSDTGDCERAVAETLARFGRQRLRHRPFAVAGVRSEEHTSELQSRLHLVCRLLLEKKKEDTGE